MTTKKGKKRFTDKDMKDSFNAGYEQAKSQAREEVIKEIEETKRIYLSWIKDGYVDYSDNIREEKIITVNKIIDEILDRIRRGK